MGWNWVFVRITVAKLDKTRIRKDATQDCRTHFYSNSQFSFNSFLTLSLIFEFLKCRSIFSTFLLMESINSWIHHPWFEWERRASIVWLVIFKIVALKSVDSPHFRFSLLFVVFQMSSSVRDIVERGILSSRKTSVVKVFIHLPVSVKYVDR